MIRSRIRMVWALALLVPLSPSIVATEAAAAPGDGELEVAGAEEMSEDPGVMGFLKKSGTDKATWVLFSDASSQSELRATRHGVARRGIASRKAWDGASRTLVALYGELAKQAPTAAGDGAGLGMYPDSQSGKIKISVDAPGTTGWNIASDLAREYPGEILVVPNSAPSRSARLNDSAPFYGGSDVFTSTYSVGRQPGHCSTGFRVRANNGTGPAYMLSAGHCFNLGQNIYSGPNAISNAVGVVNFRKPITVMDLLLIGGGNYGNKIYSAVDDTTSKTMVGAGDMFFGSTYCNGGMIAQKRCGGRVNAWSAIACDALGCTPVTYGSIAATRPTEPRCTCRKPTSGTRAPGAVRRVPSPQTSSPRGEAPGH